jgi:hypothetical protein
MIQPIDTNYNGYRFRSRLEARWAIFFDCVGLNYGYEVEGFEFNGRRYLPDFYLPLTRCFVEVKPVRSSEDNPDMVRALILQSLMQANGVVVHILCGNPWKDEYTFIRPATGGEFTHCRFGIQPYSRALCFIAQDGTGWGALSDGSNDCWPHDDDAILDKAFKVARSARFEHNEEPAHV